MKDHKLPEDVGKAYGRWCCCFDHRIVFDACEQGMMCPKSARRKSLVNADCQVGGTWHRREGAERRLLRDEVAKIEAGI